MKFKAAINVMPLEALLDPQGKAVSNSMITIGLADITNVRVGRHVHMQVEAASEDEARTKVDEACKKLLYNQIMESYNFTLEQL
jgi:phosphoribosylformylglycinamidine synthase subunit PurS